MLRPAVRNFAGPWILRPGFEPGCDANVTIFGTRAFSAIGAATNVRVSRRYPSTSFPLPAITCSELAVTHPSIYFSHDPLPAMPHLVFIGGPRDGRPAEFRRFITAAA